ncbi:hypothetical protein LR48_Vigan02g111800 [Vigna angularis]|uniref:NAF domain-containing protein n=1 Tax=Phaseolus angularis TaxID=3914 RepID=A0A0L9TWM8_PHAAN|nr:hypothetical protein LR48_Vigan02g111800 [Vigna angularis]
MVTEEANNNSKVPKFFNAFKFISSISSGFDLSGLFETKRKSTVVFTSKCSAVSIMAKIVGDGQGAEFHDGGGKELQDPTLGDGSRKEGVTRRQRCSRWCRRWLW